MKKRLFFSLLVVCAISVSSIVGVGVAKAAIWNLRLDGFHAGGDLVPGGLIDVSLNVCAERDQTTNVTVQFYLSQSPAQLINAIYLGSDSVRLFHPSSYCINTGNNSFTLPTVFPAGDSCYVPNSFIIAKIPGKQEGFRLYLDQSPPKTITGIFPDRGFVGDAIEVTGTHFHNNMVVSIGSVPVPYEYYSESRVHAIITENAASGDLRVYGNPEGICEVGTTADDDVVVMDDPHVTSSAMQTGYGKIAFVGSQGEFVTNTINDSSCPTYTNYLRKMAEVYPGQTGKQIVVQFGACNTTDYAKLFKLYIDWNGDYDFDDPGELAIGAPSVVSGSAYTITLNVPQDAALGKIRMRMILALYYAGYVENINDVQAGGQYPFGETEDFTLKVVSPAMYNSLEADGELETTTSDSETLHKTGSLPSRVTKSQFELMVPSMNGPEASADREMLSDDVLAD